MRGRLLLIMCMACAPERAVDAEKASQSADKRMVLEHGDNGVDRVAFDVELLRGDHLALRIQHDAELPLRAGDRVDVVGVASAVHEVRIPEVHDEDLLAVGVRRVR